MGRSQAEEEVRSRILAVSLVACLAGTARAATVPLQAAHVYAEDHAWHKGLERFAEVLKASPDAGLELVIHSKGTWGGESDYVHSLRQGLLDIAIVSPSVAGTVSKNLAFLDVMYLWRDREHWRTIVDGPVGERIAEMIEAGTSQGGVPGLKVLGFWGGSRRHLLSRKQGYASIESLHGLRIGVQDNPMNLEIWRALGLEPVSVPLRNSAALLEADIVEAVEAELGNAIALKLIDTASYVTLTGHALTLRPLVMSDATWRKLTPEQQQLVTKAAAAATATVRELELKQDDAALETLRATGARIQEFKDTAEMRAHTAALRQKLAEEAGLARLLKAIDEAGQPAH
jgi:TRAP-type C4-dicarboxylate transport system substrate-binding protein